MPAPNLQTLQNIAPLVEKAFKERLTNILPAFMQREADDLPHDRVDIMFAKGQWTGHWGVRSNGQLAHAAWVYTITLNVFTRRPKPEEPDLHAGYVAGICAASLEAITDPAFLQYHTLCDLNESSQPERTITAQDQDCTAVIYSGTVVIRSDAWPIE